LRATGITEIVGNDAYGGMVWSRLEGIQTAGVYSEAWDGTFNNGTHVPDGQYNIKVTVENVATLGSLGSDTSQFYYPQGVAVDAAGSIYVPGALYAVALDTVPDSNNGKCVQQSDNHTLFYLLSINLLKAEHPPGLAFKGKQPAFRDGRSQY
jgi:hypothetical protein